MLVRPLVPPVVGSLTMCFCVSFTRTSFFIYSPPWFLLLCVSVFIMIGGSSRCSSVSQCTRTARSRDRFSSPALRTMSPPRLMAEFERLVDGTPLRGHLFSRLICWYGRDSRGWRQRRADWPGTATIGSVTGTPLRPPHLFVVCSR